MTENKKTMGGFKVDDYFIALPPKDFIVEDDDGNMHVLVDIYKLEGDTITSRLDESEITADLEQKISAYLNEMLIQAAEAEGLDVKD